MRDYPHGLKDKKIYNGIVETDAIAGCASVMRSSRLRKVGLSDQDFFLPVSIVYLQIYKLCVLSH